MHTRIVHVYNASVLIAVIMLLLHHASPPRLYVTAEQSDDLHYLQQACDNDHYTTTYAGYDILSLCRVLKMQHLALQSQLNWIMQNILTANKTASAVLVTTVPPLANAAQFPAMRTGCVSAMVVALFFAVVGVYVFLSCV